MEGQRTKGLALGTLETIHRTLTRRAVATHVGSPIEPVSDLLVQIGPLHEHRLFASELLPEIVDPAKQVRRRTVLGYTDQRTRS